MANRYWVGGTGTWDTSSTTHWSSTDGGSGGASVPTSTDDVFITSNSGFGSGGTITIDNVVCQNLTATSGHNFDFYASALKYLRIYGNLQLEPGITSNIYSALSMFGSAAATIDVGGASLGRSLDIQGTGLKTLVADIPCSIDLERGYDANFDADIYDVGTPTKGFGETDGAASTDTWTVHMGSGTWYFGLEVGFYNDVGSTFNWYPETSTVVTMGSYLVLDMGGANLHNFVWSTHTDDLFTFTSMSFDSFVEEPTDNYHWWEVWSGSTISFNGDVKLGDVAGNYTRILKSDASGYTFSKSSGTVYLEYVNISDCTATGGATWIAAHSIDSGGNSGWNLPYDKITESGSNVTSTSLSIDYPAYSTGDLIIVNITAWTNSGTPTMSFTAPNSETVTWLVNPYASGTGTDDTAAAVGYFVATSSHAAGSLSVTSSVSTRFTASVIKVLSGQFDATTPLSTQYSTASSSADVADFISAAFTAGSTDQGGALIALVSIDQTIASDTTIDFWLLSRVDRGRASQLLAVRGGQVENSEYILPHYFFPDTGSDAYACVMYIIRPPQSPTVTPDSPYGYSVVTDTTPTLAFTGANPANDDIRYNVQIDTVNMVDTGYTDTYYFDGSNGGTDDGGEYTDEANAVDGSTTTYAESNTYLAVLEMYGTNAPASGGAIKNVRWRMYVDYTMPTGADGQQQLYSGSDFLSYMVLPDGFGPGWTDWTDMNIQPAPTGGWTWQKIQELWAMAEAGDSGRIRVYKVEIEVASEVAYQPSPNVIDKVSGTDSGFSGSPDNADPFTSGQAVTYTVQAGDALTAGTTYYWRVRGIDPSGTNTYGPWSETHSFDIETTGTRLYANVDFYSNYPTTTERGTWTNNTGAAIGSLSTSKYNFWGSYPKSQAETSASGTHTQKLITFRSPPMQATSFTTSDTLSWCLGASESDAAANMYLQIHAYVMKPDGTVRGTLVNNHTGSTELPTTASGVEGSVSVANNVSVLLGDFVVIEVGYKATNTVTTSYTGTIYKGVDEVTTTDLTGWDTNVATRHGWFQFSNDVNFVETFYWVGGSGNISDSSNWSHTSGGASGIGFFDGYGSKFIFDENSLSASSTVTFDTGISVHTFDANNVSHPLNLLNQHLASALVPTRALSLNNSNITLTNSVAGGLFTVQPEPAYILSGSLPIFELDLGSDYKDIDFENNDGGRFKLLSDVNIADLSDYYYLYLDTNNHTIESVVWYIQGYPIQWRFGTSIARAHSMDVGNPPLLADVDQASLELYEYNPLGSTPAVLGSGSATEYYGSEVPMVWGSATVDGVADGGGNIYYISDLHVGTFVVNDAYIDAYDGYGENYFGNLTLNGKSALLTDPTNNTNVTSLEVINDGTLETPIKTWTSSTPRFDGNVSITDPDNVWANEAYAVDNIDANFATTSTSGSDSANYLEIVGTNFTGTGLSDYLVVRVSGLVTTADTVVKIYDGTTLLATVGHLDYDYRVLQEPAGGWTLSKIQNLKARVYTTGASGSVARITLHVTGTDSTSTHTISDTSGANYVYDADIQGSTATGGATFYAIDSTNSGGNTGWNFSSATTSLLQKTAAYNIFLTNTLTKEATYAVRTLNDITKPAQYYLSVTVPDITKGAEYVVGSPPDPENLGSDTLKRLKIGQQYGPVTSVVLGRQPQNDNIVIASIAPESNLITDINTSTNLFTVVGNSMVDGNLVRIESDGTLPAPLQADTNYYVYTNGSSDTFALTTHYELAIAGLSLIDITTTGSGTITLSHIQTQEVQINNNQIMDDDRQTLLPELYTQLVGIEWNEVEAETVGLGWHEVGDVVEFTQGDKTVHGFIDEIKLTLSGSIKETLKSSIPDVATINYQTAGGILQTIYNTEIKVDKQENNITSIVSQQDVYATETQENFSQIYQDLENIALTIQKSGGGNLIENSVGFATELASDYASQSYDKLSLWDYNEDYAIATHGTVLSYSSSVSQNAGGVSGQVVEMAGASITLSQRISVAAETPMSLGIRVKNQIGTGTVTITVSNDLDQWQLTVDDATNYDWDELSIQDFQTSLPWLDIEIACDDIDRFQFTDLRLLYGTNLQGWVQSASEILATNVQFTKLGMKIFDNVHDTETQVTYNEFSTRRRADGAVLFEADDSGVVTNDLKINGETTYNSDGSAVIKQITIPSSSDLGGIAFVKGS